MGGLRLPRSAPPVPPLNASPAGPDADDEPSPRPSESNPSLHLQPCLDGRGFTCLGLDRLGITQALGGLILGLIALFSSYDHIALGDYRIPLQQQWGLVCIAASLATVLIDAELASRSRLRETHTRFEERNRADQERDRADQERNRAAEARKRQAESLQCQDETLDLLRRSALLSGRVQLDPNPTNRARLQVFLSLLERTRPPWDERL